MERKASAEENPPGAMATPKKGNAMNITRWEPLNLARWEPFREMEEMFRRMPLFGRGLHREGGEMMEWTPAADIVETEKEFLIKAELPEVKKEDVKIMLENGVLTIEGERRLEKELKEQNVIRTESFYGKFARSFALPENVDVDAIRAESKDGVLRVHIPKTAAPAPKPVSIEVH
jgi:HSP20 family protein